MSKKMEEFFNLPPMDSNTDEEEDDLPLVEKSREELFSDVKEITASMTTADKVDSALPVVTGLDSHDSEMDAIAKKAMTTFEDLVSLGGNVPDMHAGKIYEVAGQMLKTALEAKNAKAEKKLRMIELQLKRVRSEQIDFENGNGKSRTSTGGEFDRNELLKHIVASKSDNSDK